MLIRKYFTLLLNNIKIWCFLTQGNWTWTIPLDKINYTKEWRYFLDVLLVYVTMKCDTHSCIKSKIMWMNRQVMRSSYPEVFLGKRVLKICSKFTGEHPCRSPISIKLLCNFIEIALRHGCSPVILLHIFRTHFPRDTSWWLLLVLVFNPFSTRKIENIDV